ncbi:10657_t:CDS:1 [Racocetra fulgida]|uniref:10657_t:CDS:1 n=1 Tax=Racocetra fulgida TaxID=60492 RepID=A0A9N9FGT0_9GLOM|nr:10657_t:CDS:1 [Racocetra fulgida]
MSGKNDGEPKYEIIGDVTNENSCDNSRGNKEKDEPSRNVLEGRNGMDGGDGGLGRFPSGNSSFIDGGHISVNLNDGTMRDNIDNMESDDDGRDGEIEKKSDGFVVNYLLVSQHADERSQDGRSDEM